MPETTLKPSQDEELRLLGQEVLAKGNPRALDLSDPGLLVYLRRLAPIVRRTLETMENLEPWVADRDWQAVDCLQRLGRILEERDYEDLAREPTRELVLLLGFVSTTRLLMFVERLIADERSTQVEFIAKSRTASEGDDEANISFQLMLNRLWFLNRRRLLHRIYAPKRAHQISRALRNISIA